MQKLRPLLLIDDDSVDAMTVKRTMRDRHITNPVIHRVNGEEAISYLTDPTTEKPFLILLDLNMPKMGGIEFLRIIKANAELKTIPVIVLTTSKEKRDVTDCFDLGATGYMVKPVDYTKFVEVLSTFMSYWVMNELPEETLQLIDKI